MSADMKAVLDRAASSPDPVIRGISLEYVKAQQMADRLRPFLEVYAGGLSIIDTAPADEQQPAVRGLNGNEFAARVAGIVRKHGQPLLFKELYGAYVTEYGSETKTETFRTKLLRCRDSVQSVDGRGYWPAGEAVPDVI